MNLTLLAILEFILAAGLIGFWIYFFKVEINNPEKTAIYFSFEKSFPLPDLGWLTPGLIISGIGLLTQAKYGYILGIAVGGGLIFLGLIDISFNIQNKGYTQNTGDTLMNLFINIVCIVFGPILILSIAPYIVLA